MEMGTCRGDTSVHIVLYRHISRYIGTYRVTSAHIALYRYMSRYIGTCRATRFYVVGAIVAGMK